MVDEGVVIVKRTASSMPQRCGHVASSSNVLPSDWRFSTFHTRRVTLPTSDPGGHPSGQLWPSFVLTHIDW